MWEPILERGTALGARARETVEAIAAALRETALPDDPSLANGKAGLALFFAELDRHDPAAGHGAFARRLLDDTADAVASRPLAPGLYAGIAGVAWTHARLRRLGETAAADTGAIDEALAAHVARRPWTGEVELVSGIAGLALHQLERLPDAGAARALAAIVARLEERAERGPEGASWSSGEHWNLGLAHGVPGVLAVLAAILEAGIEPGRTRALLTDGVRWLRARRVVAATHAFAAWVAPGDAAPANRTAWCYGDPGVAVALLHAARALGDDALAREACELAALASRRPVELTAVEDAGLCHGAAGLGHVLNRLAQATGSEALRASARTWLARALDLRDEGTGLAGFTARVRDATGELRPVAEPGLLVGAAGIALALLAALEPVEPAWDGWLLLSFARRSPRP